jgi:hypothetical protein
MAEMMGYKLGLEFLVHFLFVSEPVISHLELPYITPSILTIGTILKIYLFKSSMVCSAPLIFTSAFITPSIT